MASLLFVHSPLVGPSTWLPTSRVLAGRGFQVAVPDLTAVADATPPRWETAVELAVAGADGLPAPIAVVGHSGAGAFLPVIGDRLRGRASTLVFVDAVVPPRSGAHETPTALKARLDELTTDGHLARWLDWWPDDVAAQLVPDPDERHALREEMPRLPRSLFDESVPVPDGWSRRPSAYLRLSGAYEAEFDEAASRGWARVAIDRHHLAIHRDPVVVADAVEALLVDTPPGTTGPDQPST